MKTQKFDYFILGTSKFEAQKTVCKISPKNAHNVIFEQDEGMLRKNYNRIKPLAF